MKSPIELQGDANLTLVVDGTFTVTGGAAGKGGDVTRTTTSGNTVIAPGKAGTKGYAGIALPVGATLNVQGSGVLFAYGGDAGRGGDSISGVGGNNVGGGGGGGAGAGIGGIGGAGGAGGTDYIDGSNGAGGQGMGTLNIWDTVTVNAYGGGGGSGSINQTHDTGGAGGYPAAGVGGGGAGGGGGEWDDPGAGFTGGRCQGNEDISYLSKDGEGSGNSSWGVAGGYFRADYTSQHTSSYIILQGLGGIGSTYTNYDPAGRRTKAGDGGKGGSGGTVKISEKATLHAYNGSYETTIPQNYGKTPTPIYAQSGYDLELLRKAGVTKVDAGLTKNGVRSKEELEKELGATGKSSTIKATGLAGVGSGAGATEASNGTEIRHLVPGR